MKLADLKQVNQKSIRNAGPRYTPGQDADAPNLEIDALNIALEGLICSPSFRERIRTLAAEIEESFSSAAKSLRGSVHGRLRKPSALIAGLEAFASVPPGEGRPIVRRLRRYIRRLETATKQIGNTPYVAKFRTSRMLLLSRNIRDNLFVQ